MPQVEVDGRRIHYRDGGGAGRPLLLFHAFPLDGRMWEGELAGLRDRFRVIAPDLSGFGQSSVPEDPASYSMDRWAEEGRAVLDACGVDRAVVGGCSMGGYVSFAFLRRFPDRAEGLLLVDTQAGADSEETRAGRTGQQEEVRAGKRDALLERLAGKLLAESSRRDAALVERLRALMDQPDDGIVGALEAMKKRPDSTRELPGIRLPTVIVVGELDPITPPAVAEAMQGAIPGARLVVLPGAGHLVNLEAADAFHRALDFPAAGQGRASV